MGPELRFAGQRKMDLPSASQASEHPFGFVDIHVHGGGGFDIMDGNVESFLGMSEMHATHGTTSMLPTTLTCTDEELFRVLDFLCQ